MIGILTIDSNNNTLEHPFVCHSAGIEIVLPRFFKFSVPRKFKRLLSRTSPCIFLSYLPFAAIAYFEKTRLRHRSFSGINQNKKHRTQRRQTQLDFTAHLSQIFAILSRNLIE